MSAPRNSRKIVEQTVGAVFQIPESELGAAGRGTARAVFARQVAMYLIHVTYGLTLTQVGALFARDRTTIAHACRVIEDRRDEPALDLCLERLECAVAQIARAQINIDEVVP